MTKYLKKGSTLIEVMGAVLIITIAVSAIVELTMRSSQSAGLAKRQTQATAYATEKMESIRSIKEASDWATFCSSGGTDSAGSNNEFSRAATVTCSTVAGKDQAAVTVNVSWGERGATKTVTQSITYYRR